MKILIAIITALIVAGVVNLKNNSVKMYDYVDESERKSDFVNLAAEFETLKAEEPETYDYNFTDYIKNCTSKNGFLEVLK